MPLDPMDDKISRALPGRDSGLAARLGDLERRIKNLEHSRPAIQVVGGAPSGAPRDGVAVGDSTNTRLWLRLNGTWRYVALT